MPTHLALLQGKRDNAAYLDAIEKSRQIEKTKERKRKEGVKQMTQDEVDKMAEEAMERRFKQRMPKKIGEGQDGKGDVLSAVFGGSAKKKRKTRE